MVICGRNEQSTMLISKVIYMIDEIIKIRRRKQDLDMVSEYWESVNYEDALNEIRRVMISKNGYPPLGNTKFIREGSFRIKVSTSIEELKQLGRSIKNKFSIDCFQIAVDRERSMATMLFKWVDSEGKTVVLNHIAQIKLGVFILQELGLPRPQSTHLWLRYFLTYAYDKDRQVFKKQLDNLSHHDMSSVDMKLIRDILLYAEGMCEGQFK